MFNLEEFDIKLDTEVIGRNFIYCDEIESTNSFLLNSKDYSENGTLLLAEYQSKGKGRLNREWISNRDQNLTFSILINKNITTTNINLLNLGSSLAIGSALENLYQLNVELKWPNDVLVNKRKIAGILIESSTRAGKIEKCVIGMGINVNQPNFTGKFLIPPTSVKKEFREAVSREKLLSEILNNFEEIYFSISENREKVVNDWRQKCRLLGEKVKVTEGNEKKFGVFADIDSDGFMILKTGKGEEKIHFGDVTLR